MGAQFVLGLSVEMTVLILAAIYGVVVGRRHSQVAAPDRGQVSGGADVNGGGEVVSEADLDARLKAA
jgi:hypothetical protein